MAAICIDLSMLISYVAFRNGVFPVDSSSPLHNDVIKPLEKPHLKVALDSDQGDKINGNDVPLSPAKQLPPLFHDTEEAPKRRRRHKKKFLKRDLGQNAGSNISSPPESETPISESAPHEGDCDDMGAQGEMPSVTELWKYVELPLLQSVCFTISSYKHINSINKKTILWWTISSFARQ